MRYASTGVNSDDCSATRDTSAKNAGRWSSDFEDARMMRRAPSAQTVVLVHSPFLGPASLQPLADELGAAGITSFVPDLRGAVLGEPVHHELIVEFIRAMDSASAASSLVVVGHSGAGPLLPAFAESVDHSVTALIYLDAELPTPGRSWDDAAPVELADQLRSRVQQSLLPPWHRWFDDDLLAELVPDDARRVLIVDEEPAVKAAFLAEKRPDAEWAGPAGYIQLSPPYASPAARSAQRGWPVRRLRAHHLAPATQPRMISAALLGMVATWSSWT